MNAFGGRGMCPSWRLRECDGLRTKGSLPTSEKSEKEEEEEVDGGDNVDSVTVDGGPMAKGS